MDTELNHKCCAFTVGDKGQRYEVTFYDPQTDQRMIFGWFDTFEGAEGCCKGISKHPTWRHPRIRDRQEVIPENLKNPNEEDLLLTIAGLRKEIADLESKVIRWIPVTERLPEKQDIYLVYDPSVYGVESDFWEIPSHGFPPRFLRLGETVTHWASRPPSPEEGK